MVYSLPIKCYNNIMIIVGGDSMEYLSVTEIADKGFCERVLCARYGKIFGCRVGVLFAFNS